MATITGIGGVFFKSTTDHKALAAWCARHGLGRRQPVARDAPAATRSVRLRYRRPAMPIAPTQSLLLAVVVTAGCAGSATRPDPSARSPGDPASTGCPAGATDRGYELWPPGDRCAQLDQRWRALPATAGVP